MLIYDLGVFKNVSGNTMVDRAQKQIQERKYMEGRGKALGMLVCLKGVARWNSRA